MHRSTNDPLHEWEGKPSPFPQNEEQRLRALQAFDVLDTLAEPQFDALTELAAHICDTPIALISLIDSDRQWFKSKVGLEVDQTPRDISFCQYAIMNDDLLEVNNSLDSPILKDNPLVVGDPNIRFYAGAPIKNKDGFKIGTLCVIDRKPKKLDDRQKKMLQLLADQVLNQLELRSMVEKERQLGKIKSQFITLISHQFRTPLAIIKSNSELLEMMHTDIQDKQRMQSQKYFNRIFWEIDQMTDLMDDVVLLGQLENIDTNKQVIDVTTVCKNITERTNKLQEDDRCLELKIVGEKQLLKVDQNHLEIILNNLISNAFKFSEESNPELAVEYGEDLVHITVTDTGIGIPQEQLEEIFEPFHRGKNSLLSRGTGLGLTIARKLTELQDGKISANSDGTKTTFHVYFPIQKTNYDTEKDINHRR